MTCNDCGICLVLGWMDIYTHMGRGYMALIWHLMVS